MEKKIQDMGRGEFLELMKTLQVDHLEPKIKSIVEEVIQAERSAFWVPAERHYTEHMQLEKCVASISERNANHEFVSSMRKRGQVAFNIGFGLAVVAVCGFVATLLNDGFRNFLSKLLGGAAH